MTAKSPITKKFPYWFLHHKPGHIWKACQQRQPGLPRPEP